MSDNATPTKYLCTRKMRRERKRNNIERKREREREKKDDYVGRKGVKGAKGTQGQAIFQQQL